MDTLLQYGAYREQRRTAIKGDEMTTLMKALSRAFNLVQFREGAKPDSQELAFFGGKSDTKVGEIDRQAKYQEFMTNFNVLHNEFYASKSLTAQSQSRAEQGPHKNPN